MNRKIQVSAGLAAELLNFFLVYTAGYIIIQDLAGIPCSVWELWILFPVPLFYYMLRKTCKNLPIFLLFHLVPVWGMISLYQGEIVKKVVMSGMVFLYAALSVHRRITSDSREMEAMFPPGAAGVFLVLYVIDSIPGDGRNGTFVLQMLIFYAAGYFLYLYFRQFLHYVDMSNRTTENIPVNNVFFSSLSLAGAYTMIALFLLTVCSNREWLDGLGRTLREGIRAVISALFSLKPGEIQIQVEQQQGGGGGPAFELPPPKDPTLLGQILDVVLSVTVLLFGLFVVMAGIVMTVRLIRQGFYRKGYQRNEQDNGENREDQVEWIDKGKGVGEEQRISVIQRFRSALTPEEKIRRLYKKAVKRGMSASAQEKLAESLRGSTARECCCILFPEKEREANKFASLYERARYGAGMCTNKDVQQAKELCEFLLGRQT